MGKFKVGDRVRFVEDYATAKKGDEGIIESFWDDDGVNVLSGGRSYGCLDRRVELVDQPWQPKVGDRVRFTEHNPNGGAYYGAKGEVFEVVSGVNHSERYGDQVSIRHHIIGWNPAAPISALEPAALTIEAGLNGNGTASHHHKPTAFEIGDLIAEWVDEPAVAVAASNDNAAPAKPKFKVGDRVRVTKAGDSHQEKYVGTTFTIDYDEGKLDSEQSWAGRDHGSPYRWKESQLEIVPVIAPTAIVALIEDGQPKPSARPFVHATESAAKAEADRLAGKHKGQQFGVYVLTTTSQEAAPTYKHEWQRLAAKGEKINAIKELRAVTGMPLKQSKDVVEHFVEHPYGAAA